MKQNLHKIEEDCSGEGQFEDMDQEWSTPPVIAAPPPPFNPPDINVTDEQGNIKSHSEFPAFMNIQSRFQVESLTAEQSALNHRSRTFSTLQDAYEHGTHLRTTREVSHINHSISPNGYSQHILQNSYEDIVMGSKNADDILSRLKQVLDNHHIEYELSSSARGVQLNHSNVQLKMEVVNTGNELNSLRFRHVSGDSSLSRQLCHVVLQKMSL